SPEGKLYIGLAFNKTTPEESNNPADYTWSEMPQNIEIGGRNLLLDSPSILTTSWGSDHGTQNSFLDSEGGFRRFESIESNANAYIWLVQNDYIDLEDIQLNKEYVVSADIRGESGAQFGLRSNATSGGNETFYKSHSNIDEDEWTRVQTVFKFTRDFDDILLLVRIPSIDIPLDIKNIKIEKGNKATDWTPAPEDVQAEIDEAKQEAERAKQEAQQAKTTADGKNSVFTQSTQPS
ncbi:hypothetical protein AAIB49_19920, partial [Ornithinibacillus sp. JPR2-1]